MMKIKIAIALAMVALLPISVGVAQVQQRSPYEADGTVHVPAFDLPPSPLISPSALKYVQSLAHAPSLSPPPGLPIEESRKANNAALIPMIEEMKRQNPVDIVDQTI